MYYTGYVDDYRMYSTALTAADISGLYNYINEVTYVVTVSGGGFYLNDISAATMTIDDGTRYIYDQSAASNRNKQISFSTSRVTNTSFTANVTIVGTPGQVGAYTNLFVPRDFTGNVYLNP